MVTKAAKKVPNTNILPKIDNVDSIQDVDDSDKTCCLCANEIEIWAIGKCKHPICYVCSSRMRILNDQCACAICKQTLETVVFHDSIFDFNSINITSLPKESDFGIAFLTNDSNIKFKELQLYKCIFCKGEHEFEGKDSKELERHMSRKHSLFSCSLCTDNYLLFPGERRWYNRSDLARHKRLGDPDNKSHKGHPQCKFCDERYLDDHELYRHLRKEHFNCHICEAEEGTREFLQNSTELVKHFRKTHFLCEHRDCVENPLTAVFKTELDMKIHISDNHGGIDKKDLKIEVGLSRNHNIQRAQEEIEEEIAVRNNEPLPNMESEELFPTLGGGGPARGGIVNVQGGAGPAGSLARKVGQVAGRNTGQTSALNYRTNVRTNINSSEDFPTLGGGGAGHSMVKKPANWSKKAKNLNKPITNPNRVVRSLPKKPEPKRIEIIPDYPSISSQNSSAETRLALDHSQTQWSQAPDVFVEKSQLELRAEREQAAVQNRALSGQQKSVRVDHSSFPTLGGAPAKPKAFWGVPGASIPKSKTAKGGKKKMVVPTKKAVAVPAALPKQAQKSLSAFTTSYESAETPSISARSEPTVNRGEVNSASDIAARLSGGYSGWSAPPETFQEKSLLQMQDEKRQNQKKFKNPQKLVTGDFPTLGGSKKKTEPAVNWGVPGSAFPKTNKGQTKNGKKLVTNPAKKAVPVSKPVAKPVITPEQPVEKPKKKQIDFSAAPVIPREEQTASIMATRMTGGYSGWSAPPTVFKEKSLLEIEQEERERKGQEQIETQNEVDWIAPEAAASAFPTLGGMDNTVKATMAFEFAATKSFSKRLASKPEPKSSVSAAELLRRAKEAEMTAAMENNTPVDQVIEPENEQVITQDDFPEIAELDIEEEYEEEEEDDMEAVNARLSQTMMNLNEKKRSEFKLASGKFRTGGLTADGYIESGCAIMGKKAFMNLLPDLLRTLPDGKHKMALQDAKVQSEN